MKVYKALPARKAGNFSLALGVFDGLHLGHLKVLKAARAMHGSPAVLTFEAPPEKVLSPAYAPQTLMPLSARLGAFKALGMKAAFVLKFDRRLAAMPAGIFAAMLKKMGVGSVAVGADFVFGAHAAGDAQTLREAGLKVREVAPALYLGRPISSTRLRHAVSQGDLRATGRMLGRPFVLRGKVVKGRRLGRKIGFPTANLDLSQDCLPPDGVYGVKVGSRPGLMNLGLRPTLGGGEKRVLEVHLLDFSGNLYGQVLEVALLLSLRKERRFKNIEALQKQIRLDEVRFRRYWASYSAARSSGAGLG